VPVWLSAGRGWIVCDANDRSLGIARILAIMLTAAGASVNSRTVLTFIEKIKKEPLSNSEVSTKCLLEEKKYFKTRVAKLDIS